MKRGIAFIEALQEAVTDHAGSQTLEALKARAVAHHTEPVVKAGMSGSEDALAAELSGIEFALATFLTPMAAKRRREFLALFSEEIASTAEILSQTDMDETTAGGLQ